LVHIRLGDISQAQYVTFSLPTLPNSIDSCRLLSQPLNPYIELPEEEVLHRLTQDSILLACTFLYDVTPTFMSWHKKTLGTWPRIYAYAQSQIESIRLFITGDNIGESSDKLYRRFVSTSFLPRPKERRKQTPSSHYDMYRVPDPSIERLEPPVVTVGESHLIMGSLALVHWNVTDRYVKVRIVGSLGKCELSSHSMLPGLIREALDQIQSELSADSSLLTPLWVVVVYFSRVIQILPGLEFGHAFLDMDENIKSEILSDVFMGGDTDIQKSSVIRFCSWTKRDNMYSTSSSK
jgi:hypothetical protein